MSKEAQKIHEGNAFNRDMIAMTMPLFLMSVFFYGPRPLMMALLAVVVARLTDRLTAKLRGRAYDRTENSSVTIALLLVLLLPASVQFRVVIAAVLAAVLVGKEAFGGYMSYPFNPVAVGFCVVVVSWPEAITRYPVPQNWLLKGTTSFQQLWDLWTFKDVPQVAGPAQTLKAGGMPSIDTLNLLLGDYAGPLGATACLVIVACAVYLVVRKRLPLGAPLCFLATIALMAFLFPRYQEITWQTWPGDILMRLDVVKMELLTGTTLFAAVFLVDEPATLPKNSLSRVVYGILLGFAVMMFRYFGTYDRGLCFAFLLVNAISGYFDRALARSAAKRKGVIRA